MTDLGELLAAYREDLLNFLRRHGGSLLRLESDEDLCQGVHLRALERGGSFRYEGREPFLRWMYTVARSFLADRRAHWKALRRNPRGLLRLTQSGATSGAPEPHGNATSPPTFADRRALLLQVVRALALLPDRDQLLVRWAAEDRPLQEQAERLGVPYRTAQTAARRALDRFRNAYTIVAG